MNKLELSDLMKKTQTDQKEDLKKFEQYMNQSVTLKKSSIGYKDDSVKIMEEILKNVKDGLTSDIPIPENTTPMDIFSILLQNQDYIEKLSDLIFIEAKTSDERLDLLVNYLEDHLKLDVKLHNT
jgi:hypothetical protein